MNYQVSPVQSRDVCVTQTLDNLNVEKESHGFLLQVDCKALSRHSTGMLALIMMTRPGRGKQYFIAV